MTRNYRQILRQIKAHPDDAEAQLKTLQLIVAAKIDATDSAREIASLSRVMLDIVAALRTAHAAQQTPAAAPLTPVEDLLARRAERGAR